MGDSVPSLKEILLKIGVFFAFSSFTISFWIQIYHHNINAIIEILVKNIWIMILLILVWIVPLIFVYFTANSLNKNASFLRSLGASLLSNIIYILISLIIFRFFSPMNQILVIPIVDIILLIVFIFIYAYIFNVNWIDAFNIVSIYAFISMVIISIAYFIIIFNLG